jgi:hypothetical protein
VTVVWFFYFVWAPNSQNYKNLNPQWLAWVNCKVLKNQGKVLILACIFFGGDLISRAEILLRFLALAMCNLAWSFYILLSGLLDGLLVFKTRIQKCTNCRDTYLDVQ